MKKFAAFTLALVMALLCLAGCGTTASSSVAASAADTSSAPASSAAPEGGEKTIYVIV